ncbi:MAG: transcriptional regulator [Desulfobulbaceae bacterium]|nr:transcriptional regulator [Desulfobulbaceae bacterium]
MTTVRQQMIELLSEEELNAREISQALSIMEREVYAHLEHIERTLARLGKKLVVTPYSCLKCGYIFENRKRWSRPGRCPICRQSHISMAGYRIVPY